MSLFFRCIFLSIAYKCFDEKILTEVLIIRGFVINSKITDWKKFTRVLEKVTKVTLEKSGCYTTQLFSGNEKCFWGHEHRKKEDCGKNEW